MIYAYIFISALVIMLASLSGALFLREQFHQWMKSHLPYLATFAGGVFIIIVWHLTEEITVEHDATILSIAPWIILGVVGLEVIGRMIPNSHHHHGEDDHAHSKLDARRMLLGDAMHNIGDGILLVTAFTADIRAGIATTIAIFAHELVQEISEFFVLKESGYTDKEALSKNFIVSGTILIGVVIGITLTTSHSFELPIMSMAVGGFIYILLRDLIPHSIRSAYKTHTIWKHIAFACIGMIVMFSIQTLIPHEEPEVVDEIFVQTQVLDVI